MNTRVAVVVINWNNWKDTIACLAQLDGLDLFGISLERIVVDNGSEDDSLGRLNAVPGIALLALAENVGFAAGSNTGIRHALKTGCDYVLLLNNDAYGEADFLLSLLQTFDEHGACGVVSPKIYDVGASSTSDSQIWYAGGRFRQPRLIGEMVGMGETDVGQHDRARVVDFAVGCCMLIDVRVLTAVGLLDEDFFFYQEDVDFSYRTTLAGYEVWYQPAALVWHRVSSSTEDNLTHRTYLYAESRPLFFVKHIRGVKWFSVLALEFIRLMRVLLSALVQRKPEEAWAYMSGAARGWYRALEIRRNRRMSEAVGDR